MKMIQVLWDESTVSIETKAIAVCDIIGVCQTECPFFTECMEIKTKEDMRNVQKKIVAWASSIVPAEQKKPIKNLRMQMEMFEDN